MIVGSSFDGDDVALAWAQHDVYHEALGIIRWGCVTHYRRAHVIMGMCDSAPDRFNEGIDHRTMQVAHDLLAAAWRFHVHPPEPMLPGHQMDHPSDMQHWLDWLREEVRGWHEHPSLVRLVVMIMIEQKNDVGYAAEDNLRRELRAKFHDVPWTRA